MSELSAAPAQHGLSGERVGILGGTFNPLHLGHLICAQEAHLQLGLDRVILVPAGQPPHKPLDAADPGAEHRLELCRRGVAADSRFDVSEVEVRRPGPSYTVDTLAALNSLLPDTELFLIVGGDVAAGLPAWREPERVLSLATLAVAKRRGTRRQAIDDALAGLRGGERALFFRMPRIGISSTEIRHRVGRREPIRYLVPDAVASYIDEHRLYGGRTRS
ncbi:MAG: nicotinate-nucleotide adenylyltransferase [Acidobacteriota bacterium]|nr:nicotinate-nucleotide adenylyltransferase [Acidobacteriota bacterium]